MTTARLPSPLPISWRLDRGWGGIRGAFGTKLEPRGQVHIMSTARGCRSLASASHQSTNPAPARARPAQRQIFVMPPRSPQGRALVGWRGRAGFGSSRWSTLLARGHVLIICAILYAGSRGSGESLGGGPAVCLTCAAPTNRPRLLANRLRPARAHGLGCYLDRRVGRSPRS